MAALGEQAWLRMWDLLSDRSPGPTLVAQSVGSTAGGSPGPPGPVTLAWVPSGPMLSNQQLAVLVTNSSHQKSVPLGIGPLGDTECGAPNWSSFFGNSKPSGAWPMWLLKNWLLHEVESEF